MDLRLRPSQRIRKQHAFQTITRKGKLVKGEWLRVWVYDRAQMSAEPVLRPQFGIIVSRKTAARATDRNLWKRRIREVFRKRQHEVRPEKVVLIQSGLKSEIPSYAAVERDLMRLLQDGGALKKAGAA